MSDLNQIKQADKLYLQKKYKQAQLIYDEVARTNPGEPLAHQGLAKCYLKTKRINEALLSAQKAVDLNNELALAHAIIGYCLFYQGKFQDSIKKCQQAIDLEQQLDFAYATLGLNAVNSKDYFLAEKHFRKALEIKPLEPLYQDALLATLHQAYGVKRALQEAINLFSVRPTLKNSYRVFAYGYIVYHPLTGFILGLFSGAVMLFCIIFPTWYTAPIIVLWYLAQVSIGIRVYRRGQKPNGILFLAVGHLGLLLYAFTFAIRILAGYLR